MPPADAITVTWAGLEVDSQGGANFTLTPGITPSTGSVILKADIRGTLPPFGDLVFESNNGAEIVTLQEIWADYGAVKHSESGSPPVLTLKDRRWKWKYGVIHGTFNQLKDDGTIDKVYTAFDLVELCLDSLGEAGYDIAAVPSGADDYPPIVWVWENPAQGMMEILEKYGLIPVLQTDNTVKICGVADTQVLPLVIYSDYSAGVTNPEIPETIVVRGGKIINQRDLTEWEAVGKEIDGTVRPINDLSYKPAVGWPTAFASGFYKLTGGVYHGTSYTGEEANQLARECIYKWYRPDWNAMGLGPPVEAEKKFLPWLEGLSEVVTKGSKQVHAEPRLRVTKSSWSGAQWVADNMQIVTAGYQLDKKLGIVKFAETRFKSAAGVPLTGVVNPDITLTIAYELNEGFIEDYYFFEQGPLPGKNVDRDHVHIEEKLILYQIGGVDQNKVALDNYARLVAELIAEQFDIVHPKEVTYEKVMDISPDYTVKSVNWSIGEGGLTTSVQQGIDDPPLNLPTYDEKRSLKSMARKSEKASVESSTEPKDTSEGKGGRAKQIDFPVQGPTTERGEDFLTGSKVALNVAGEDIPVTSLAVMTDVDVASKRFELHKPTQDNDPNGVVVVDKIPDGDPGRVWETTTRPVKYDPADGVPIVGDTLGTKNGSWLAKLIAGQQGMLLVRAVEGAGDIAHVRPFRVRGLPPCTNCNAYMPNAITTVVPGCPDVGLLPPGTCAAAAQPYNFFNFAPTPPSCQWRLVSADTNYFIFLTWMGAWWRVEVWFGLNLIFVADQNPASPLGSINLTCVGGVLSGSFSAPGNIGTQCVGCIVNGTVA